MNSDKFKLFDFNCLFKYEPNVPPLYRYKFLPVARAGAGVRTAS
jgi:hypothetical protein